MQKFTIAMSRVSTNQQDCDLQVHAMKEEIKRRKLHVVPLETFLAKRKVYEDREGICIWTEDKKTGREIKREGYLWTLGEVRAGHVQAVLCYRADRVGRNVRNNADFLEACKERKTELFSLREGFDATTAAGRAMFNLVSSMAEYQSDVYSENVKAGIAAKKERCRVEGVPYVHGGTTRGWTYQDKIKLLPTFYKQVELGMSNRQIRKVLGWDMRTIRKYRKIKPDDIIGRKELNTKVFGKSDAVI